MGLGANFISYPTALSMKLFAIAFDKIKKRGVTPFFSLKNEMIKMK